MQQAHEDQIVTETESKDLDRTAAQVQPPIELDPSLLRQVGGGTGELSSLPGSGW